MCLDTDLSSRNPIPFNELTLILFPVSRNALLNNPVGPPILKSSPVASFINAPEARGASINITFLLWGDRAASKAAETPTGPAPSTARSYVLSDTSSGDTAASCNLVYDDEEW